MRKSFIVCAIIYDIDISFITIDHAMPRSDPKRPQFQTPFSTHLQQGRESLRKGERTRLDLLQSAMDYLAEHSLDGLTVAEICQRTGVAHGTFYLHFKDRHALVQELLRLFVDYLQQQMLAAAREPGDPVRNSTANYFYLFKAHAGLMKCLVIGMDAFPEARAAFHQLNHQWANIVARAHSKDTRDPTDKAEILRRTYALGGMVDQYLTALFVTADPWLADVSSDDDAVINTLTNLWKRGMQI
ncbi:MAG: TetR/AcrR family transcriptional regulator [Gammaproteobacteria bacterium]|nr:TetR/AcrR family transcriptional regulator [Gammaproteobacteria bacterium]